MLKACQIQFYLFYHNNLGFIVKICHFLVQKKTIFGPNSEGRKYGNIEVKTQISDWKQAVPNIVQFANMITKAK